MIRLALLALIVSGAASAQAPALPRATDGHPDLEGVWISRWLTPLERQPPLKTLAMAPEEVGPAAKAEWARHNAIDSIEGTDSFEFSTFVTVRGEMRSSIIVDPPDGRLPLIGGRPPVRPQAQSGFDGPEARALNERCLSPGNGAAPHLSAPSGNIRQIVQAPGYVTIHTELLSSLRILPLDGRTTFGSRQETQTARWDGDALVIETTNFRDPLRGVRGSIFPVTPKTRIVERFTLTRPDEITYTFTVEDPALYARPWTGETVMLRTTDRMFEFACHEGNYGLANILSGARVAEQRAAKAAKTASQ
jgi:hypothetical protein